MDVDGATAHSAEKIAGSVDGYDNGKGSAARFQTPKGAAWCARTGRLYVADLFNHRIRTVQQAKARLPEVPRHGPTPRLVGRAAGVVRVDGGPVAAASTTGAAAKPMSVLVWTGHSGPYHDHFENGRVLAKALNASTSPQFVAHLACSKDDKTPCEAVFADADLATKYDVILI